ncbi:MAG: hypothetical protein EAY75_15475 [Bacteroidetes bacterium]|nr:MAG: hypothetical protein EAY75_15475 [Bacteroidota bacterium]
MEKAINLLNELKALQAYAMHFTLADYANPQHASHLQTTISNILVRLFGDRYGNGDEAAANSMTLIMSRQIASKDVSPERLQGMMVTLVPLQIERITKKIEEMILTGDQEADLEPPPPVNPINN